MCKKKHNMSKPYPVIVVFDLDGTIIGPSNFVSCLWLIMKQFVTQDMEESARRCKEIIIESLRSKLARPHFKEFIDALHKKFEFVELFVYTAAGADWTEFVIGCVEDALNIRFNRPLFSREQYTFYGSKHLTNIIPEIQSSLKDKHGFIPSSVLHDTTIVFEDNPDVYTDAKDCMRIFKCPTYGSLDYISILGSLPEDVVTKNYKLLAEVISMEFNTEFTEAELATCEAFVSAWAQSDESVKQQVEQHHERDESRLFWKNFQVPLIQSKIFAYNDFHTVPVK